MPDEVRISARAGTRSVDRAVSALQLLAASDGLGLGEIARALGIPKSSAADVLRALVARDVVAQDQEGQYRLGLGAFEIGAAYVRAVTQVTAVSPELTTLTAELRVPSHFAVLDGDDVVYVVQLDPPGRTPELAHSPGVRVPAATTAAGRAQLAYRPPGEGELRFGAARVVERTRIRALGYALDAVVTAPGYSSLAAAIFSPEGCCGALGVSSPFPVGPSRAVCLEAVLGAAARVTARLGGVRPHEDAVSLGRAVPPGMDASARREALG